MTKKEEIEFHIKSGDYFATLATVLDLVGQAKCCHRCPAHTEILNETKEDLMYIQEHYRIVKKIES